MKKLAFHVCFLLSFVFLLPLGSARAAQSVAQCGTTEYASLPAAFADAVDGDTIILLRDAALSTPLICDRQVTLEGDGYALTVSSRARIEVQGGLTIRNLYISAQMVGGYAPLQLSADHAALTLDGCTITLTGRDATRDTYLNAPQCIQIDRTAHGGKESPANVSLRLIDSKIDCAMQGAYVIACASNSPGSSISCTNVSICTAGTKTLGYAFYLPDTGDASDMPSTLTLTGTKLVGFAAGLYVVSGEAESDVLLDGCEIRCQTPLVIGASQGRYTITDSILACEGPYLPGLASIRLIMHAQGNRFTLSGTRLTNTLTEAALYAVYAADGCSDNRFRLDADCTAETASPRGLFCAPQIACDLDIAEEMSFGAGYPLILRSADGFRNACSALIDAQTLWQDGDTVTLCGAMEGAVQINCALTLRGADGAALSGALAVYAPGVRVEGFDLSACTVHCTVPADLSRNYWGGVPPNLVSAETLPYYRDAACTTLAYPAASDAEVSDEWLRMLNLTETIAGDAPALTQPEVRTRLYEANDRLRQRTTAAQRAESLADEALRSRILESWAVYRTAFPITVKPTALRDGCLSNDVPTAAMVAAMIDNPAGQTPAALLIAGTACPDAGDARVQLTITSASLDETQRFDCTVTSAVLGPEDTELPASECRGTYRIPLPRTSAETANITDSAGQTQTVPILEENGCYLMCSQFGTVSIAVEPPAVSPPDEDLPPHDPDTPSEDPNDPPKEEETPAPRLILRAVSHGKLTLHSDPPQAAGDRVRVAVEASRGYELDELTVLTDEKEEVSFRLNAETLTFRMPDATTRVRATFSSIQANAEEELPPDTAEPAALPLPFPFLDVVPGDWFRPAVYMVWQQGLMQGVTQTQFAPHDTLTRAMLVTILYRQKGQPPVSSATAFRDLRPDAWYAPAALWARAAGIVQGTSDALFLPMSPITREQIAVLLYRMDGCPPQTGMPAFIDAANISDWALDAVQWCTAHNLLQGDPDGTFRPQQSATRAEAATILARWLNQIR